MLQPLPSSASSRSPVRDRLTAVLTEALRPSWLEVIDESHLHAGHAGWRPTGETHMRVRVVAEAFTGKSRVARHRMINELAAAELQAGLHALAVEARAPGEKARIWTQTEGKTS
jgi:BolA family transcriptional regulator, general stress-responsive regulator